MRRILLAILISAGPLAPGQQTQSRTPNPTPCKSTQQLIAPRSVPCVDSFSPTISILPTAPAILNWTDLGSLQVKPAVPAHLTDRGPNPIQFLAHNNFAPMPAPNSSPRAKAEPIPTTFPNAHVENIPTTWPDLKLVLVDQTPPVNPATDSKQK
jgi:hypothetical protein